ncbi:hypothetical protein EV361DRAFT_873613 [Lentinula raphanica]|nr:hypothetical protein EV361DRAFT_873613 [Lentinula raphanica]
MYVSGPDTKSEIPEAGSPPPYAASDPSSSSSSPPFVLPDSVKPSNYLSLSQTHNSFRGTYVIDPSLEIPSEYLPPLPDGENEDTRSNFYARSTHGNVNVDLYLLDKVSTNDSKKRVLLCTSSAHGSVYTTIVEYQPGVQHRADTRPSFELKSSSKNGDVNVKIPRSFRGPVTGTTVHGQIVMSDAVSSQAMVFSDVQGVKRIFIGDMSTRNEGIEDSLFLESAHGSIRIYFEDEDSTPPIVKSMIGIWSKMFGRG